jgi:hypothetical protein
MATAVSLTGSTAGRPNVLPSPHHAKPISIREGVRGKSKSKTEPQKFRYYHSGRIIELPLKSTSSNASWAIRVLAKLPPEHLQLALHVGGSKVSLRFSDGFFSTVDLARLGIDATKLKMATARASWGSAVEVEAAKGKAIHIDSAVLRAQCDPKYAAELAQAIADLDRK